MLEITLAIREYWRDRDWRTGFPVQELSFISHPCGCGRSTSELQKQLEEAGVLGGTEDSLPKGNVHYGANLQRALDVIDQADWETLRKTAIA